MTIAKSKITAVLMAVAMIFAVLFTTPGPAKADHVGPFVYNEANQRVVVGINGHCASGCNYNQNVYPGDHSHRGATRVNMPSGVGRYIIIIQSISTGRSYSSPCGGGIQIGNGDGTGNSAKVTNIFPC